MFIKSSGFPLEAEAEAVGVGDVKLLHAVVGNFGRVHGDAFVEEVLVGGVDVGAAEVDAGVAMGCGAGGVGRLGTFAVVVGGVEHELCAFGATEKTPAEFVGGTEIGVADELEFEDVAVEVDGGWHVKDLEEGTKAAGVDGHGVSRQ